LVFAKNRYPYPTPPHPTPNPFSPQIERWHERLEGKTALDGVEISSFYKPSKGHEKEQMDFSTKTFI